MGGRVVLIEWWMVGARIQYSGESLSSKLPCHLGTLAGFGVNKISVP